MENTKADKSFSDIADFFYKRIPSSEKNVLNEKNEWKCQTVAIIKEGEMSIWNFLEKFITE